MDFFFCLPIVFGCPTKIKPDGDQSPRICPRCNNAAVHSAKSRLWFELCFVPLIPMHSQRVWICTICQWSIPLRPDWEPALPGQNFQRGGAPQWQQGQPPSGYMPPPNGHQPGYQPGYISPEHGPNAGQKAQQ